MGSFTSRQAMAAALAAALLACGGGSGRKSEAEPAGYLGPTLELEAPGRGAMLEGEAATVVLAGQACDDAHEITGASLAGAPLSLEPAPQPLACRAWSGAFPARVGLNVVRGEVRNSAGERGTLAQSFLLAPAYDDGGAPAPSGILLQLGQRFLDDGDRATIDDVASVVEWVLRGLDLDATVGPVRFASPDANGDGHIDEVSHDCVFWTQRNRRTGFEAWKNGPLTHGGLSVDSLTLEDGGIAARMSIRDLRVPFRVTGNVDSGCLGDAQDTVNGDVKVSELAVEAHAAISLDGDGNPMVTFPSTGAALIGLDIDISLGFLVDWTGVGSLIGDRIEASVRGPIESGIRDAVQNELGARLAELLPALADLGGEMALPGVLGARKLALSTRLDRIEFTSGHALLGASVNVHAAEPLAVHAGARGPVRLGGELPDPALAGDAPLALAISDDALNQVLHAAWQSGALDLANLGELIPDGGPWPGARISLLATLPPVVVPHAPGSSRVDVGWGDVAFDVALAGNGGAANARGYFSLVLGLERIEVDAGGLRPVFAPDPEVDVQVTLVDWDHLPTTRTIAEGLVRSAIANALPDLVGNSVGAFVPPALDLGALDPALSGLTLAIDATGAARSGGYQVVVGNVRTVP